jgi:2'-5' RNA ligase
MKYYLEIWLRGFAKDYLRKASTKDNEKYHPHITLVRPFDILTNEVSIMQTITGFCQGTHPIQFTIKDRGSFGGNLHYAKIINETNLLEFNNTLEKLLENSVTFAKKLDNKKVLHATYNADRIPSPCPKIDQYMLRLTAIRDKKIWFSYDFVTKKVLNREDSLSKELWHKTVRDFERKYGLKAGKDGFVEINN